MHTSNVFCFLDRTGRFSLDADHFFTLKSFLKERKIRSAYEIFYATCKLGLQRNLSAELPDVNDFSQSTLRTT